MNRTTTNDGLRFFLVSSIIRIDFGRDKFGSYVEGFWRRIIDDLDAFSPLFWLIFVRSNLTALGGKCHPGVGTT